MSETTPLKKQGQTYKNDIRVERQRLSQIDTKVMPRKVIEPKRHHFYHHKREEVTTLKEMTKGERLVAEMFGDIPKFNEPVLTEKHPFLRKVLNFMENRREWQGTATELLEAIGDSYTPPNTVTKLLNKYDCSHFYGRDILIKFHRTNRKRIIRLTNYNYQK